MQSDSQKAMTIEGSALVVGGTGKAAGEAVVQVEGEAKLREFLKESIIRNVL